MNFYEDIYMHVYTCVFVCIHKRQSVLAFNKHKASFQLAKFPPRPCADTSRSLHAYVCRGKKSWIIQVIASLFGYFLFRDLGQSLLLLAVRVCACVFMFYQKAMFIHRMIKIYIIISEIYITLHFVTSKLKKFKINNFDIVFKFIQYMNEDFVDVMKLSNVCIMHMLELVNGCRLASCKVVYSQRVIMYKIERALNIALKVLLTTCCLICGQPHRALTWTPKIVLEAQNDYSGHIQCFFQIHV